MFEWLEIGSAGSALAFLVELTVKSTLVLGVAAVLTFFLRRAPAADRHRIWFVAITGIVLFPVLSVLTPGWSAIEAPEWLDDLRSSDIPLFEQSQLALQAGSGVPTDGVPESRGGTGIELSAQARTEDPSAPEIDRHLSQTPGLPNSDGLLDQNVPTQSARSGIADGSDRNEQLTSGTRNPVVSVLGQLAGYAGSMHWTTGLFWIWLMGASLVLMKMIAGAAGVLSISLRCRAVTDKAWLDLCEEVGDRLFLTRRVRLVKASAASMPMTWGGIHPVVLLPTDADDWSEQQKRCVLTHEFAHVKRWDTATQGVAQLACALFWFNPFIWMAAKQLRIEREKACDEYVVQYGARPSQYAEHLLDMAKSLKSSVIPPLGAVAMARPSQLEGRVLSILRNHETSSLSTAFSKISMIVLAGAVILPLAAMSPSVTAVEGDRRAKEKVRSMVMESGVKNLEELEELAPKAKRTVNSQSAETETELEADTQTDAGEPGVAQDAISSADADTIDGRRELLARVFTEALSDDDADIRRNAARMLGELEVESAVDDLGRLLSTDSDEDVRMAAAWALGEIDSDEAAQALIAGLDDDSPDVRKYSLYAIEEIGLQGAVDAVLTRYTTESSTEVRSVMVWVLGEFEDERAVELLVSSYPKESNPDIRRKILWALTEIESIEALPVFRSAIRSDDAEVRSAAVYGLGELEDERAIDALSEAVRDSNAEVRRKAVWALGEIESPAAFDALAGALEDSDMEVRRMAVWALGELEDDRAVPALTRVINDGDPEVRRRALWALTEIESPESVDVFIQAIGDPDREIRRTAVIGLSELEDVRSVDALMGVLGDENADIRRMAAHALGEIEDDRATDALAGLVNDTNREVRRAAIHALSEFETERSRVALIAALDSEDPETRESAVMALHEFEDAETVAALGKALASDPNFEVKVRAARTLMHIETDDALDALDKALESDSPDVRDAVLKALGAS